ncbi:MAG TPA: hypothetical protein VGT78_05675 [Rhizomicrobium sp.]|nr:hypothetical protein [Rhizomicrobium sp.]
MDRRYYLLKIAAVVIAVAIAAFTGSANTTRAAHAINLARYSAPAQVEAAAWHTTAYLARGMTHLIGLCATTLPQD